MVQKQSNVLYACKRDKIVHVKPDEMFKQLGVEVSVNLGLLALNCTGAIGTDFVHALDRNALSLIRGYSILGLMEASLLQTKLYIPPPRPNLVPRLRLTERLNEDMHRKFTLISAPAGFGKTILVSDWLRQLDVPIAWVSLDENDNDSARFLTYFITAFRQLYPSIGQAAQAILQSPQLPPLETLITTLINDISAAFTDTIQSKKPQDSQGPCIYLS